MSSRFPELPEEVHEYIRGVFADSNQRASAKMARMPTTHETSLDLSLIEALSRHAAPQRVNSEWLVKLDTHYLGGGRHFGEWEVADVGIVVVVRDRGRVTARKVVVLQSKRLYPDEQSLEEDVPLDYRIGFGRLMVGDDDDLKALERRTFNFTRDSQYKALDLKGDQRKRIDEFQGRTQIPVHYLLYNPLAIPWQQVIPVEDKRRLDDFDRSAGSRVVRANDLHPVAKGRKRTYYPSFAEAEALEGWSLEVFVANEILRCREGYVASRPDDPGLVNVFSRRTGPIAASLSITIDRVEASDG